MSAVWAGGSFVSLAANNLVVSNSFPAKQLEQLAMSD
jgi:hypothetical protein